MCNLVKKLVQNGRLSAQEYGELLANNSEELRREMAQAARAVAEEHFGNKIYTRGLIEVTNVCRNNCYYCGIRAGNSKVERFRLTKDQILACCRRGYDLEFRTFVLQGGEDPSYSADFIVDVVQDIRREFPDCAITLSMGEWGREDYERFYNAGANRYLLRHETHNAAHYGVLHPKKMTIENRLRCLNDLKEIGFQTGTGFTVGSPGQTIDRRAGV